MDFLNQLWTTWNNQWAANVATILSIIAIVWNAGDRIHRLTSSIRGWKVWAIILRWFQAVQRKYRVRRAKNIMGSKVERTGMRISIRTYERCLVESQRTLQRNELSNITPEKPSWLNDYYVASALESLWRDGKIVKGTRFVLDRFPPDPGFYLFINTKEGTTAKQQADTIETESQCLVHQIFRECLEIPRYEGKERPETIAPGRTQFPTEWNLRDDALPCSRCWEVKAHGNDIRLLVDGITKYDLATSTSAKITGMDREFQEAVIAICIERQCAAEVATIKKILERAIEIRGRQIRHLPIEDSLDWTDEQTKEFTACLDEYIKTKVQ